MKNDPAYAKFYAGLNKDENYIILDNSAHEMSAGDSVGNLLDIAVKIPVSEIVLPDRLFFGDDTLERSISAAKHIRAFRPDLKIMGVPQGRTIGEWITCLEGLLDLGVDTIGVSKDYEAWDRGLFDLIENIPPEMPIHLLGWGRKLWHLNAVVKAYDNIRTLRGTDSAKPFVYALSDVILDPAYDPPKYPRREGDYFGANMDYFAREKARLNIEVFRTCANGAL